MSDILHQKTGVTGIITLNRPKRLNALSQAMIEEIAAILVRWREDVAVKTIVINAVEGRAFCAGGDVLEARQAATENPARARAYFNREYRLNAMIADYPKPIVCFMDGLTLGGGVGLGCHARYRVVTQNTRLGMPETAIGFVPDVGGTYLLAHAPGHLGPYLGMTGAMIGPEDGIYCGFADYLVASNDIKKLTDQLIDGMPPEELFAPTVAPPQTGKLQSAQPQIDDLFNAETALKCTGKIKQYAALINPEAEWLTSALDALGYGSPTSIALAFAAVRQGVGKSLKQCLQTEFNIAWALMQMPDFFEGVRAALVDKDRNPTWSPSTLADVSADKIKQIVRGDNVPKLAFDA